MLGPIEILENNAGKAALVVAIDPEISRREGPDGAQYAAVDLSLVAVPSPVPPSRVTTGLGPYPSRRSAFRKSELLVFAEDIKYRSVAKPTRNHLAIEGTGP